MIQNTRPYYFFIRLSIWALRAIFPASLIYCSCKVLGYSFLPWQVETTAVAEVLFYFFISLPRQHQLNNSGPQSVRRSCEERRALFEKCWTNIPDLDFFFRVWFKGAPLNTIYRDDLKDFLSWGFLYKPQASPSDDDELEEYILKTEHRLGITFPLGRGPSRPSQVSTDPLNLQHKPLIFYLAAVFPDDLQTYLTASLFLSLTHYRLPLYSSLFIFPPRPHTLFSPHISPSPFLPYYYRPHTSPTTRPLLLIHGIGAGLRTYTSFLSSFIKSSPGTGIIALEMMQISMRITTSIPPLSTLHSEIIKILNHHDWDKCTILAHSYGTIIANHLLKHSPSRISSLLLVDPVTLSIHWGGIPYNFLYRQPKKASEWQLHYFASRDMGVAHSITRRFDWSENVMWKEELMRHKRRVPVVVALAEEDIIVDTEGLKQYLVVDKGLNTRVYDSEDILKDGWNDTKDELGIIWFKGINHSEMFDKPERWDVLVEVVRAHSTIKAESE
ncbi:alpha beta hydrolase [Podospora fimiseda]|uniref:Alpha beta hydrolase n=1 Tax=Podospora fimiseda TaxID=252190 RepID=A0AAN7BK24_9PEZI|nr:alpha beta hydrolase [Podospora fimiseda]